MYKRQVFNILEEYEIGIMIAIGFQDTYHVLPQRIKKKRLNQEQRKPLFEIAFIEDLDNPHGISGCSACSRIL